MSLKLFYVILGATPKGRHIEQHDVFFGIAENLRALVPAMKAFWPEAEGKIHIDCFQEVHQVDGFSISITERTAEHYTAENHLFFINLGGYAPGQFTELHEQHLMTGPSMASVIARVKKTDFYRNMGFPGAESHVDDKYGVDIDDIFPVQDLLPQEMKQRYRITLTPADSATPQNRSEIGYIKIDKI